MTASMILDTIALALCLTTMWLTTRSMSLMATRAQSEIELARQIQLVIEDLISRDPQIQESLEVAHLELEKHISSLSTTMNMLTGLRKKRP